MYTPNGASDIISSIHNCQVNVSKTDQNRMAKSHVHSTWKGTLKEGSRHRGASVQKKEKKRKITKVHKQSSVSHVPDLYHRWNCADHADQTPGF